MKILKPNFFSTVGWLAKWLLFGKAVKARNEKFTACVSCKSCNFRLSWKTN